VTSYHERGLRVYWKIDKMLAHLARRCSHGHDFRATVSCKVVHGYFGTHFSHFKNRQFGSDFDCSDFPRQNRIGQLAASLLRCFSIQDPAESKLYSRRQFSYLSGKIGILVISTLQKENV